MKPALITGIGPYIQVIEISLSISEINKFTHFMNIISTYFCISVLLFVKLTRFIKYNVLRKRLIIIYKSENMTYEPCLYAHTLNIIRINIFVHVIIYESARLDAFSIHLSF